MKALLCLLALMGCSMPTPMKPATAEEGTVKVLDANYAGTAWGIAPKTLVTAGHVCLAFEVDAGPIVVKAKGRYIAAHVMQFEESEGPEADLCLLHTDVDLVPALVLAPAMPITGDAVGFDGLTSGQQTGQFFAPDFSTAPCAHGDSGSAMYDAAGVWGVLVQSLADDPTGQSGCRATTLGELRSFLDSAHVTYDVDALVQPDPLME